MLSSSLKDNWALILSLYHQVQVIVTTLLILIFSQLSRQNRKGSFCDSTTAQIYRLKRRLTIILSFECLNEAASHNHSELFSLWKDPLSGHGNLTFQLLDELMLIHWINCDSDLFVDDKQSMWFQRMGSDVANLSILPLENLLTFYWVLQQCFVFQRVKEEIALRGTNKCSKIIELIWTLEAKSSQAASKAKLWLFGHLHSLHDGRCDCTEIPMRENEIRVDR